jgi:hypothetical protein
MELLENLWIFYYYMFMIRYSYHSSNHWLWSYHKRHPRYTDKQCTGAVNLP